MTDRSLGHRAPLLWLVLPFMGGLAAGRAEWAAPTALSLALALAAAMVALGTAGRAPRLWMAAMGAAMLLAGSASYSLHRVRQAAWEGQPPRVARLSLRITHVYLQSGRKKAAGLAVVIRADGPRRGLQGQRIYYSIALRQGQAAPERSEVMLVAGLLVTLPRRPAANTFDDAMAALGINFRLTRARILVRENPPTLYRQFCERLARQMNAGLGIGLERRPELAAMYRAMMLGRKADLRPDQKSLFLRSGAMHLFAINGLHIGMVTVALHAFLALLRWPRLPAGLLVLAVLWLDVDTTGASPSAVRAFIMVAALETARALRQPGNPIASLAASAVVVLLLNPLDFFSASFRMSYAVVGAILLLGLPLAQRLKTRFPPYRDVPEIARTQFQRRRAAVQRHLLEASGIGLAAALVSALTGLAYFQLLTPAGFVANLGLVPLASLVIVAGCLSLAVGFAGLAAGSALPAAALPAVQAGVTAAITLFNHAAALVLELITALMQLGQRAGDLSFSAHYRTEWIGPAALAALLAACLTGYATGWRRHGGWWPPFVVVAVTLIFGVKFA